MNDPTLRLVVGKVLNIEKHSNSDRLFVAQVGIDNDASIQVIFGTMAVVNEGDLVPVAIAPCVLPTGLKIEKKDIRGTLTEGMLCLNSEFIPGAEKILTKFPEGTEIGSSVVNLLNQSIR